MKRIDVDKIELKKVHVGDIDIAYKTFGSGEPILLIMGFSGAMDMWQQDFLTALSSQYKVIIFDSRGIGESGVSDKKFSIELFADDASGLLDAIGIKRADVL
ncbi:MAG: alpha/beta hydrolase, partial [Dehalococcoidia bacterium]